MNERIRELEVKAAKLATISTPDSGNRIEFDHLWEMEFRKKFVELIVKEFIKIADDEASRYYNMNEDDCASVMLNYMELVKQHFGVEE